MTASDTSQPLAAVLAEAARAAGHAPSIHNTQPWRWRVNPDGSLDLFRERGRQLAVSDPQARLSHISCGAALHHARLWLAAQGWQVTVALLPDTDNPDHLARLTPGGREAPTDEVAPLLRAIAVRHTDRRPAADLGVPAPALAAVLSAATAEGAHLHYLGRDQVIELASVADAAQRAEGEDPSWLEELTYWAGVGHPAGAGVPAEAIPAAAPETTVPGRDFGRPGSLPTGHGHDNHAIYAILYGTNDEPTGWLHGGQALSAAWLTATVAGLSVLPLSGVIELDHTRALLSRLLAGVGYPYLVLRLGIPVSDGSAAPPTPRLPIAQVVEVVA